MLMATAGVKDPEPNNVLFGAIADVSGKKLIVDSSLLAQRKRLAPMRCLQQQSERPKQRGTSGASQSPWSWSAGHSSSSCPNCDCRRSLCRRDRSAQNTDVRADRRMLREAAGQTVPALPKADSCAGSRADTAFRSLMPKGCLVVGV